MSVWEWEHNILVSESDRRENESWRHSWWLSSHQTGRGFKICQGCPDANKGYGYCISHCMQYQTIIGEANRKLKENEGGND